MSQHPAADRFALCSDPIDAAAARCLLADPAAGGFCSFEGWVRDHHDGRPVRGLAYESYAALAEREGARILAEARQQFALRRLLCLHRTGVLAVGELAVWVGVSAAHRDAAFGACRFIIDAVKARVPIWKHERYADGGAAWIHCCS